MAPATFNSDASYLLSDLIGAKARVLGKAIGKLSDIIVNDGGKVAEVTHLLIDRPFGHKSLMVPWDRVEKLEPTGSVLLRIESPEPYEGEPAEGQICLRDHLLDKKVLDCDDDEVEVVYDIKLTAHHGLLYVTGVDCSRAGFLRRIGLRWLANFLHGIAAKINEDTIPWAYVQRLPQNIAMDFLADHLERHPHFSLAAFASNPRISLGLKLGDGAAVCHASCHSLPSLALYFVVKPKSNDEPVQEPYYMRSIGVKIQTD